MVPPALVIVIGTLVLLPLLNAKVPPASTGLYVVPRLVTVTVEPVVILVVVGVDVVVVVVVVVVLGSWLLVVGCRCG